MTDEYDAQFKAVKELKMSPWVGKDYNKTKIFILGESTDDRNNERWDEDLGESLERPQDITRSLVPWINEASDKPFRDCTTKRYVAFRNTVKIFTEGVGADYGEDTCTTFWETVAFNNYYQQVLPERGGEPNQSEKEMAKYALEATINIIKPKLVVAWGVRLLCRMGLKAVKRPKNIGSGNGAYPRVFQRDDGIWIVGIQHPSMLMEPDSPKAWFDFLCSDEASKKPIGDFVQHLKQRLVN